MPFTFASNQADFLTSITIRHWTIEDLFDGPPLPGVEDHCRRDDALGTIWPVGWAESSEPTFARKGGFRRLHQAYSPLEILSQQIDGVRVAKDHGESFFAKDLHEPGQSRLVHVQGVQIIRPLQQPVA